jgi:hypothetical protein
MVVTPNWQMLVLSLARPVWAAGSAAPVFFSAPK